MNIIYQLKLIQAIRDFFVQHNFTEIPATPLVENPGMETHIHPFEVIHAKDKKSTNLYLHTSPEFFLKEVLATTELTNIFCITHCFRDEPASPQHRPQFLMCEWYRKHERYEAIMQDCENLFHFTNKALISHGIKTIFKEIEFTKMTVRDLFFKELSVDLYDLLETDTLLSYIKQEHPDVILPTQKCSWDDYFFLLFLNKVEPALKKTPFLLLYEFPHQLAALSTLKANDSRVCERFEIYSYGLELCNCFNELTDLKVLKERFNFQAKEKQSIYGYSLPEPKRFYKVLKNGYPPSAGIALGIDRLLMALTGEENLFYD